jgi:hypothetical protein
MLNNFGLPLQQASLALAALDAFKVRIRPADADRAVLGPSVEERAERRRARELRRGAATAPLVKANAMFAGASFITGVVVPPPPPAPALRALPGDVVSPEIVRPLVLKP